MKVNWDVDAAKYLNDKSLKIIESHLNKVCLIGKGKKACRYIALTTSGYVCVKNTPLKMFIDKEIVNSKWRAIGDNCDGFQTSEEELKKGS